MPLAVPLDEPSFGQAERKLNRTGLILDAARSPAQLRVIPTRIPGPAQGHIGHPVPRRNADSTPPPMPQRLRSGADATSSAPGVVK